MKLSAWANKQGISYTTAWRWFRDGRLPVRAEQMATGTAPLAGALPRRHSMRRTPPYAQAAAARNAQNGETSDVAPAPKMFAFMVLPGGLTAGTGNHNVKQQEPIGPESSCSLRPRNASSSPAGVAWVDGNNGNTLERCFAGHEPRSREKDDPARRLRCALCVRSSGAIARWECSAIATSRS